MTSFEAFYRSEYRAMLGIALSLANDTGAAEDLVQEAFISAQHRWDRVSQYDNPKAWVRRVLINRATSLRRRVSAELRAISRVGPPDPASPDLSAETAGVWAEVHRLPRRQQQAVALHYVGQLSMVEIADVMGCSQGAVKSHLHRARESLRASLAAWDQEEL
jgi:RNA polymerase sigma-70 factor (ECF subfamily)